MVSKPTRPSVRKRSTGNARARTANEVSETAGIECMAALWAASAVAAIPRGSPRRRARFFRPGPCARSATGFSMSSPSSPKLLSERRLLFLIGAVQFVNILDFVMVMPLGPDLARSLGMRSSDLGLVGGSYTAAAAVSGLIGSLFLDRFDRRSALAVALVGL